VGGGRGGVRRHVDDAAAHRNAILFLMIGLGLVRMSLSFEG
jgi:hypothetical protein